MPQYRRFFRCTEVVALYWSPRATARSTPRSLFLGAKSTPLSRATCPPGVPPRPVTRGGHGDDLTLTPKVGLVRSAPVLQRLERRLLLSGPPALVLDIETAAPLQHSSPNALSNVNGTLFFAA